MSTGSHSRSTNQVGGNYPAQILLPDGTNVTPRPLLPSYLAKDTDDIITMGGGMVSKVAIKNNGQVSSRTSIRMQAQRQLDLRLPFAQLNHLHYVAVSYLVAGGGGREPR